MILAIIAKRGSSDLVRSGSRWSRLDQAAAQSEHSCCRHGDVAEDTTAVDNSVDQSSQSTAHAEAWSVIVERVDMELGVLPPHLADCESTSSVHAFMRLPTATFAISSDVRVNEEIAGETGFSHSLDDCGRFRTFPDFRGMKKFKNSPLV